MPEKSSKTQSRLLENLQREKATAQGRVQDRFQRADQALGVEPPGDRRRKPGPKPSGKVRIKKLLTLSEADHQRFAELAQRCIKNRVLPPNHSGIASAALRALARLDTKEFLQIMEEVKSE